MYYKGTLEEMQAIESTICTNAGLPNGKGTNNWADPRETVDSGVYAVPVPVDGWNGFTYEDMSSGVDAVEYESVEFPQVDNG